MYATWGRNKNNLEFVMISCHMNMFWKRKVSIIEKGLFCKKSNAGCSFAKL
jgi:hypothetical protein